MADGALKLVVHKGPSAGLEAAVGSRGVTIGSDSGADLVLRGDEFISPQHARVVWGERGATLRNQSPNGTLVNGRSINEAALDAGDSISIGLLHLISVVGAAPAAPSPRTATRPEASRAVGEPQRAGGAAAAADKVTRGVATPPPFKVPIWLVAYLAVMGLAFVFFTVVTMRGSSEASLPQVESLEQTHSAGKKYAEAATGRVMRLLEIAVAHERRGDARSAYEVYREVLSARQPVDPASPAYQYAAARIAVLGPK